jgi:hypothetical protein
MMTNETVEADRTAKLDEAPEPDLSPLGEDATAADIAASVAAHVQAAEAARGRSVRGHVAADEILSAARQRADQILAEAEEQAAPLRDQADEAGMQARELERIAAALGTAVRVMSAAEEEDAKVAALRAERAALTSQAAELTAQASAAQGQLKRLAARRGDLESELAAAAGDDDLAIELSEKISGIATTEAQVSAAEKRAAASLAAAQARITAINREDPPYAALFTRAPEVGSIRFRALCLVDDVWRDRPGAAGRRPAWYALNHGLSFSASAPERPGTPRTIVLT